MDIYRGWSHPARRGERSLPRAAAPQPQLRRQHRQDQRGGRCHPRGRQVEIFVNKQKIFSHNCRDIAAGEEVSDSYGMSYIETPLAVRQRRLLQQYKLVAHGEIYLCITKNIAGSGAGAWRARGGTPCTGTWPRSCRTPRRRS